MKRIMATGDTRQCHRCGKSMKVWDACAECGACCCKCSGRKGY